MDTPAPEYDLTVITVCWKAKELIPATVGYVERQKALGRIRIEHIFVDGGSADGSAELLRALQEAGRIERYVSEPDKGIYDAMNKGIRMARGKVLYFLNVGDHVEEAADFSRLILPIVQGECDCTCGQWRGDWDLETVNSPTLFLTYLRTPCCHQAFFLSKEWYQDKLGGYDTGAFRCLADCDLMWRMYAAGARIQQVEHSVILYMSGGLSENSRVHFLNELSLIRHRHKDAIAELVRTDRDYGCTVLVMLLESVHNIRLFAQEKPELLAETVSLIEGLRDAVLPAWKHPVSRWLAGIALGPGLRSFAAGKTGFLRHLFLWRLPALLLPTPKDAKYEPYTSPYCLKKTLRRIFRRRG